MVNINIRVKHYITNNAWQQIEDERKNIMGFKTSERAKYRTIKDTRINWSRKSENSTIIHNSPARKMTHQCHTGRNNK